MSLDLSPYDWVIGISDISLTGHADLVVRARTDRCALPDPGLGDRLRARRGFLAQGMGGYDLAG